MVPVLLLLLVVVGVLVWGCTGPLCLACLAAVLLKRGCAGAAGAAAVALRQPAAVLLRPPLWQTQSR